MEQRQHGVTFYFSQASAHHMCSFIRILIGLIRNRMAYCLCVSRVSLVRRLL